MHFKWLLGLGFGSTLLGKKAAMLCTASVEEVIDEHYLNQIKEIKKDILKPSEEKSEDKGKKVERRFQKVKIFL